MEKYNSIILSKKLTNLVAAFSCSKSELKFRKILLTLIAEFQPYTIQRQEEVLHITTLGSCLGACIKDNQVPQIPKFLMCKI